MKIKSKFLKLSLVALSSIAILAACSNDEVKNKKDGVEQQEQKLVQNDFTSKLQTATSDKGMTPYGVDAEKLDAYNKKSLTNKYYSKNIITIEDVVETLNQKGTGFIYFYSPACVHCATATPVLSEVMEDTGASVAFFNVLFYEEAWEMFGLQATPTFVYFEEGQFVDGIVGAVGEDVYQGFFDKYLERSYEKSNLKKGLTTKEATEDTTTTETTENETTETGAVEDSQSAETTESDDKAEVEAESKTETESETTESKDKE